MHNIYNGVLWWLSGKEFTCNAGDTQATPFDLFLPGEFHGQKSLEGLQSVGSQTVRHD